MYDPHAKTPEQFLRIAECSAQERAIICRLLVASVNYECQGRTLRVTITKPRYGFVDGVCTYELNGEHVSRDVALTFYR
jgi:hypothetical protein